MGEPGEPRMVVQGRALLLQEIRGQSKPLPDQNTLPRDRGLPDRPRGALAHPVGDCLHSSRPRDGIREQGHKRGAANRFYDRPGNDQTW